MVIAAVDPGTERVGYCLVLRGSRFQALALGTIVAKGTRAARLRIVHDRLSEIFGRHRPTEVVVERAYVGRNAQSAIALGEARGVALVCADRVGAKVFEYTAPEAKRAVAFAGAASKADVQRSIQLLLGLKEPPAPDAADAAALAILHAGRR